MIESQVPDRRDSNEGANAPCVYSFEWFLRRYVESRFPASLRRHLGVSDIVQSVFCIVAPRLHQFRGSTELEFRGWLIRIAERKILDGLRRYRQRTCPPRMRSLFLTQSDDPLDERTPRTQVAIAEEARLLLDAIARLPPDVRAIVMYRHVKGKTFDEISAELSIPVTTCRRRWFEGLQQIESHLGDALR
jgi:RNA polymerase sigma factor (sigma-70 family)